MFLLKYEMTVQFYDYDNTYGEYETRKYVWYWENSNLLRMNITNNFNIMLEYLKNGDIIFVSA